jgi:hypothetical protein
MVVRAKPVEPPLTAAADLDSELNQLALGGHGWAAVLRRLSAATGRPTRLIGVHGGVLAASATAEGGLDPPVVSALFAGDRPTTVVCSDGFRALAVPVVAGSRRVGALLMRAPVRREYRAVLAGACTAIAIEAVRRDAVAEATAERASRLIDELRFGSLRDREEVSRAAERFGLALERPHAAAVFAYHGQNRRTWATALSWIEMPVRADGAVGWTVLTGDISRELSRIRTRLEGMVGDSPVLGATGPVVVGVHETARSFREAELVFALLRQRAGEVEITHTSLGLAGLLLALPPERLRAFVQQHLGPILDRPDLLETLEAWLRYQGSRSAVAAALNLHRNSVGYRVGRVRSLLGVDPLDAGAALHLQAALVARTVLQAFTETAPFSQP